MTVYWLTPLCSRDPLTFGADRVRCEVGEELESFRRKLHDLHPRCLMMFKANIFLSDEDIDACGVDDPSFDMADGEDIVFDENLPLSHCAEAFLDRLPSLHEVSSWLVAGITDGSPQQVEWLDQIRQWHACNKDVILIREDGGH